MFATQIEGGWGPFSLRQSNIPGKTWPAALDPASSIELAAEYIAKMCPSVHRVGLGSYGPLDQVITKSDKGTVEKVLGRVTMQTRHKNLQGLEVLRIVEASLKSNGVDVPVRVWTDVMCGAVAESLDRCSQEWSTDYTPTNIGDVIFFLHVGEGVGGTFAANGQPWQGAQHSEVGYVAAQIVHNDDYVDILRKSHTIGNGPLFVEDLIEEDALLGRTGAKDVMSIPADHRVWNVIAEYIAQVCQMATVVVAPHRIVLHGLIFERRDVPMLENVRKAYKGWVKRGGRIPVYYAEMADPGVFIDRPLSSEPLLRGAVMLAAMPEDWLLDGRKT